MKKRTAFSLLELVLALGLTVVIMAAITAAIRLYLFQLERQADDVERRQIARGVLRMVTEDVRAAIQFKPEDYAGLEDLVASQNLAGLGTTGGQAGGEDIDANALENQILDAVAAGGGPAQSDGATESAGNDSEEDSDEEQEEPELGRPTLVGDRQFLRIDVSRLPRLDEYNPLIVRKASDLRLPADVKSVTYFFSNSPPSEQLDFDPSFGQRGGLYRRVIDRAVEAFQSGDNDIEIVVAPDAYSELISPEISTIEFRYWDGENWLVQWDSTEMMGFPSAIEVAIVIDPERFSDNVSFENIQQFDVEIIRTVIHLPVAEIIEEEEPSQEAFE